MFTSASRRVLWVGLSLWVAGTVILRLAGERILHPHHPVETAGLYLASFLLMAFFAPRIFRRMGLSRDQWPRAVTLLILPTLILDACSCACFAAFFQNIDPGAAGVFGGWMLICCGGAVTGVWRQA